MSVQHHDTFVAHAFPLHGHRLIEASAGTGKTYSIANLYLRLILGDNTAPLNVSQILVVTFTKAATNELRGRIREKLRAALIAFRSGVSDDAFITELLARTTDEHKNHACTRLSDALVCMDEASVFTIHGFAVRAIQSFLFETGALAEVEVSEKSGDGMYRILLDYFRSIAASPTASAMFNTKPFTAWESFRRYFSQPIAQDTVIKPLPAVSSGDLLADTQTLHAGLMRARDELKTEWQAHFANKSVADIQTQFNAQNIGLKFKAHHSVNYLLKYLTRNEIEHKQTSAQHFTDFNEWQPIGEPHPLAQLLLDFREHIRHSQQFYPTIKALVADYARGKRHASAGAVMGPDDVIALINRVLSDEARAPALRNIVTSTYPVCLVDEFQDTDPAQFAMFNRLYAGDIASNSLVMIGDPKQSIYGFRGADIFSYLGVRDRVVQHEHATHEQHIFTLDVNYRSKQQLVTAVNALFHEPADNTTRPTFSYAGLPYRAVQSCEALPAPLARNKGEFNSGVAAASAPLIWVGNNTTDDPSALSYTHLRRQFARDTAQRIASMLQNPAATIKGKRVCANDIVILVKSVTEARVLKQELQTQQVNAVYISQRDSVFAYADFAEDIYHILRAIDNPQDKRLLRSALVTPLLCKLCGDFSLLTALEYDDGVYEQLIEEFADYAATWDAHGVLAALEKLALQRALVDAFAHQPDCDRLITDFRHLGDLLQQQYLVSGSREQLIDWYARQITDQGDLEEDATRLRLESDDSLLRIVTIHTSKGLEYPIVFLPFFFMPKMFKGDPLPFSHAVTTPFTPTVDFTNADPAHTQAIQQEALAEEMRLLYVAVTRAIYQCYIGISAATYNKNPVFSRTLWPQLLGIDAVAEPSPSWFIIRQALQQKFADCQNAVAYVELGDTVTVPAALTATNASEQTSQQWVSDVVCPDAPFSSWVITSYSRLAHARSDVGLRGGASDERPMAEVAQALEESDELWRDNIRYTLKGSANTGDCLHGIYEQLALEPARNLHDPNAPASVVQDCLRQYGLEHPEQKSFSYLPEAEKAREIQARRLLVIEWLNSTLDAPLIDNDLSSSLRQLYLAQQALPEMDFDFSLGSTDQPAQILRGINTALAHAGVQGIQTQPREQLSGLMTGSIDLLFIHNKKVYVLDYKSNTLGKAPRFYDHASMTRAMQDNRYDLQYLIYSVAAHRYMQQRLGARYAFDNGEYSFGGVLYLFLRGMGLPEYPQHGIWFHRPDAQHIIALDNAFKGEVANHA